LVVLPIIGQGSLGERLASATLNLVLDMQSRERRRQKRGATAAR
jgi:hypothetical protein